MNDTRTNLAPISAAALDATVKQVFEAAAEEGLQKIINLDPDLGRDRLRRELSYAWNCTCLTANSTRLRVARARGIFGVTGWSERVSVSRIRASIKRVAATADYSFRVRGQGSREGRTEMAFAGTASERLYNAHRAAEESAGLENQTRRAINALESLARSMAGECTSEVDVATGLRSVCDTQPWQLTHTNESLCMLKNRLTRITNSEVTV